MSKTWKDAKEEVYRAAKGRRTPQGATKVVPQKTKKVEPRRTTRQLLGEV